MYQILNFRLQASGKFGDLIPERKPKSSNFIITVLFGFLLYYYNSILQTLKNAGFEEKTFKMYLIIERKYVKIKIALSRIGELIAYLTENKICY